jgi:hypothetical protein
MKTTLLIILLAYCTAANAQTTNPAPYCPNEYDDGAAPQTHYISSVTIGSFTNVSGNIQQPAPHYIYYNNIPILFNLIMGQSRNFSIHFDGLGGNKFLTMYAEWNKDGVFDVTEQIAMYSLNGSDTMVSGVFAVPASAAMGITRLRIVLNEDTSGVGLFSACGTTVDWGETEDYDLNIGIFTGIDEQHDASILISPNPVMNNLTLQSENEIQSVIIYNASGQKVYESRLNNEKKAELNLKDLPAGIYNATVRSKDGLASKSFVKE